MFLAAQHIQRQPAHIFYLGDDLRDIQAANASGMQSVAVTWGFHLKKPISLLGQKIILLTVLNN